MLTRFLTWAYRHDLVVANPMEKIDRVKREPPLPRGVGRENIERILAVIPPDQKRDRLLFRLILETGLRAGEALALHVEDLVLTADDERLHVIGKGGKPPSLRPQPAGGTHEVGPASPYVAATSVAQIQGPRGRPCTASASSPSTALTLTL